MEGHVNIDFFQTQLKSVLHILMDVAVTEITHIFQCTVGRDTGRPSIRNSDVLECRLKSALEEIKNSGMSPNDKTTNYNRPWYLGPQPWEKSDCTASTSKRTNSNILLKNEREDALWEGTGSTQDCSLLRGNTEQLHHIPEGGVLQVAVSRNEKARLTPINHTTSPLDQSQEDDPTIASPPEQPNKPEVPSRASVASHKQESSPGLRIVSVCTSPLEDSLKVEDLEADRIAASTPRKRSSHPTPSERQETRDTPLIPPLRNVPTRSRAARRPDFNRVLEAKVSEPSDVKERFDTGPVGLPESRRGEDTMEDFVLTLNSSSSSSTASSPTLPFPSPTFTFPSPSTTSSPPPPPASSSSPIRHRACSVHLVDIRKALAPLALAPLARLALAPLALAPLAPLALAPLALAPLALAPLALAPLAPLALAPLALAPLAPLALAPLALPSRHFVCQDCGKLFERRRDFRRHRRFHTGEKPYGCGLCRRFYTLKSNLRLHQKEAHSGGEPHLCEFCGKRFTYLRRLTSHTRFHTGEKPFHCTFCGKRFRLGKNLRRHISEHFDD